jgi:hypothetical protein
MVLLYSLLPTGGAPNWGLSRFSKQFLRDCPKRGTRNAPGATLASLRRANWSEKPLFSGPQGCTASAFEAFRTVSEGRFSEVRALTRRT